RESSLDDTIVTGHGRASASRQSTQSDRAGRPIPPKRLRKTEAELGYCLEGFAAGPAEPSPSHTPRTTLTTNNRLDLRRLLLDHTTHPYHWHHSCVACGEWCLEPRDI